MGPVEVGGEWAGVIGGAILGEAEFNETGW